MSGIKIAKNEEYVIEGRDEHGFVCAQLKWDGCLNVWFKSSVLCDDSDAAWTQKGKLADDCDYLHLCDPIQTLESLLEFLKNARKEFEANNKWCGEESHG